MAARSPTMAACSLTQQTDVPWLQYLTRSSPAATTSLRDGLIRRRVIQLENGSPLRDGSWQHGWLRHGAVPTPSPRAASTFRSQLSIGSIVMSRLPSSLVVGALGAGVAQPAARILYASARS